MHLKIVYFVLTISLLSSYQSRAGECSDLFKLIKQSKATVVGEKIIRDIKLYECRGKQGETVYEAALSANHFGLVKTLAKLGLIDEEINFPSSLDGWTLLSKAKQVRRGPTILQSLSTLSRSLELMWMLRSGCGAALL